MPSLHRLFHLLDRYVVALIEQCLPVGKAVPSSCADIFYGVFMSAVAIAIMQPPAPDTAGFVPPPSERPSVEETIERFAPQVRFHPEERYFPSSVSWFLERTEMRLEVEDGADVLALDHGETAPEVLPAVYVDGNGSGGTSPSRYFLQIANNESELRTREGDMDSAETYVHFRKASDGSKNYDIQYWFFFPYSGPVMGGPVGGAHEGDWEHITVRVDPSLRKVKEIFYAAHDAEGRWMRPSQVRFVDGDHPVVYIARFGHASYARPGLQPRGMLPADRTANGGVTWDTWQDLELVATDAGPRDGYHWLSYSGRWGEVGSVFSGPHGPAFQHYWLADN
jgi:hypothetical protein